MKVYLLGVNYSKTPVAIREKLTISSTQLQDALHLLGNYVSQGIILSTCNRVEIYTVTDRDPSPEPALITFLKSWTNLSDTDLLPYTYIHHDEAAIKHLFSVASGLDSMIVGEYEILGQLRQAFKEAEKANMVDLPLLRLFQRAIGVGRRVRAQTGISKSALSVSSVAVELAATVVGDLSHCRVLVVGAGEAGRLVAKAVKERGGKQITVASRTLEKASALATALGGKSLLLDNLTEELANADVVISSTAAPHLVLRLPMVKEAISTRPKRPLVIIDIAVPRDVDSRVKQIDNVFLYDINDFTNIIEQNREQRRQEIQRVTKVIDAELEIFISRWQTYEIKPTIAALVTKAENIRQVQLNKTLKKLPRLSAEQQASLEAMTRSIVQKILHEPIQCLKRNTHKKESYTRVVNELFHLDKEKPN